MSEYEISNYDKLYTIFNPDIFYIYSQQDLINKLEYLYESCIDIPNMRYYYSEEDIDYYVKNNIITPEFLFQLSESHMYHKYHYPLYYNKIYKMFDVPFLKEYLKYYADMKHYTYFSIEIKEIKNYEKSCLLYKYCNDTTHHLTNLEIAVCEYYCF